MSRIVCDACGEIRTHETIALHFRCCPVLLERDRKRRREFNARIRAILYPK